MATEWAVEYYPNDSDSLVVKRGFVTYTEARKWVAAENLYDRAVEVDIYQVHQ